MNARLRMAFGGLALVLASGQAVLAEVSENPARSARGGLLARTEHHQFEVFFYETGVRVFPLDRAGMPIDASALSATVTFYHPNSPQPWFSRALRPAPPAPDRKAESLDLAVGLAAAPAAGARATFEVTGLSGPGEGRATFTLPLEFVDRSVAGGGQPTPRYLYGAGYYGYGYYQTLNPQTGLIPAGPHTYATTPGMFGPGGMEVGPYHRDWPTGREVPLARPWLRPMD